MINAELEAAKIPKLEGGKSHSGYPDPKSQYPPPPPTPRAFLGASIGRKCAFGVFVLTAASVGRRVVDHVDVITIRPFEGPSF